MSSSTAEGHFCRHILSTSPQNSNNHIGNQSFHSVDHFGRCLFDFEAGGLRAVVFRLFWIMVCFNICRTLAFNHLLTILDNRLRKLHQIRIALQPRSRCRQWCLRSAVGNIFYTVNSDYSLIRCMVIPCSPKLGSARERRGQQTTRDGVSNMTHIA